MGLCFAAGSAWAVDKGASPAAAASSGALGLDAFYEEPVFDHAKLSPNGQLLAMVQGGAIPAVTITDLKTGKATPILPLAARGAAIKGLHADWIEWKSNDRLIVGLHLLDIQRLNDKPDGEITGVRYGSYMMAIDCDGKNPVHLLKGGFWSTRRAGKVSWGSELRDDPNHILAVAPLMSGFPGVWKVDVHTGDGALVASGDGDTEGFGVDRAGEVVMREERVGSTMIMQGRSPGETQWSTIYKLRPKDTKALSDFQIEGPAEKPGQVYVLVTPKDKSQGETRTVRIYDMATKKLSDPVWPALKYDIEDVGADPDTGALRWVCYTADVYTCDFKAPELQANFKAIAKFFDNDRSITPISIDSAKRRWLFLVSGPDEPASYYLFDWDKKSIDPVGQKFEHLPSDGLAEMTRWSYATRDGATISAYLTRPRTAPKEPLPLIVAPHGGPEARDAFEFDPWLQYLATRGYLVFQANFRGSGGMGLSWAEAGYGQWGGRMADDITDGVKKLIEAGQADPNRICIFGASYGGYAALYAGATHPELYKCVVSWAGLSDLPRLLNHEKFVLGDDSETFKYVTKSIGDPDKDMDALVKASPVSYAASYKPPVLLIHGEDDDIAPPEQSRVMEAALRKAGKDVKLVLYKDEGHPYFDTRDDKDALEKVAKFIEAHIAPIPMTPAAVGTAQAPK